MKKTNSSFYLLLLMLTILFSACGGDGDGSDTSTDTSTDTAVAGSTPVAGQPVVFSTTPALDAQLINLDDTITVLFNEPIDGATVTPTNFVVTASSGVPVGTLSSSVNAATFTGTLPLNATITVTIDSILDTSGDVLATPHVFTFQTIPDPLFNYQWYLSNTGQSSFASTPGVAGYDMNWIPTYKSGVSGIGVIVAVVDTGLEIAHEDLIGNVVVGGSWNFNTLLPDSTNASLTGDHGTSVAGIIAAKGQNGIGLTGIAHQASLKGFNFLVSSQSNTHYINSIGGSAASPNSSDVSVFNQSFGTSNSSDFPMDPVVEAQYLASVTNLRAGKGAIFVKSSGNGFNSFGGASCGFANSLGVTCQNANMSPTNTLPYNIVVGALDASGVKSSYSTAGSALWISAPGGEYGYDSAVAPGLIAVAYEPAMVTTDQSTCASGYSKTSSTSNDFNNGHPLNLNCNYTSTFNGTSSAAPAVSGVVALMLEANPALTWRDVKHILAATATQVDASNAGVLDAGYPVELGWTTNAAGYKFHNYYGFGAVNTNAAVAMALTYAVDLGVWLNSAWSVSGTINIPIPDDSNVGASHTMNTFVAATIEAVQISVNIAHTWTGDVGIELTSPSGTKSILFNIWNGFSSDINLTAMVLSSNAFYGESSAGNWTIKVIDGMGGDIGTLTDWKIKFYGH